MADVQVLEAEQNGHDDTVPDFAAAGDFGEEPEEPEPPAAADLLAEDDAAAAPAEQPEEGPSTKLYFVRIPRPPVNDDEVKKLAASFAEQVAKVKAMNSKLGVKRVRASGRRRRGGNPARTRGSGKEDCCRASIAAARRLLHADPQCHAGTPAATIPTCRRRSTHAAFGSGRPCVALQEELRELRKQMGVARFLKDGSQPEFEEKLNRVKQLQEMRDDYQKKAKAIREGTKGMECRSEEELDARVKELEDKISHGSLALREEKAVVSQISKLRAQRSQVQIGRAHV